MKPIIHTNPAWRERGNVKLPLSLVTGSDDKSGWVEELWCKHLAEFNYQVCCIPFRAYDLALGDVAEAKPAKKGCHTITRILRRSGHSTFRIWFVDSSDLFVRESICEELVRIGCLLEWSDSDLLAIDATSESQAEEVQAILTANEGSGHLRFERSAGISSDCLVHLNPIWRERANFIIGSWLPARDDTARLRWEQLWARKIADNHFEVCCIPFFSRNLALGDEVETAIDSGHSFMVQRVVKPSGHWTLRVWFGGSKQPEVISPVLSEIQQIGCLMEFYSDDLLGISAPSIEHAQALIQMLSYREQQGELTYETGWTNSNLESIR